MCQLWLLSGFFLIFIQTHSSYAQLPSIACPHLFEYQGYAGQYIGKLKIVHNTQLRNHTVYLSFSQNGYYEFNFPGTVNVADSEETTKVNLRIGRPVQYRVDFPIPHMPPKLINIRLNDAELCSASKFPPPSTTIELSHTLAPTTSPLGTQWPQFEPEVQPIEQIIPRPSRPNRLPLTLNQTQPVPQLQATPPPFTPSRRPLTQPNIIEPAIGSTQLQDICGRERVGTTPLIFGGHEVERGQLPWLVGLFERRPSGMRFFCGGTLISSSTVLSAAHCFRHSGRDWSADRTAISLGRNTLDLLSEDQGQLISVSEMRIHEQYNFAQFSNDLVLLRLERPVRFTSYIIPICLWGPQNRLELPNGEKSYVAGWGADGNGNVNTDVARVTDTNIVIESRCKLELGSRLAQPNNICAKKVGEGPCGNDDGGALMLKENNVWMVRGVVIGGAIDEAEHTCNLKKAVAYTDVAKYGDWVRANMWN